MLNELSKEELIELLYFYDIYIQTANDENACSEGWFPVCIEEFHKSDYQLLKENDIEG